MVYGLHISGTGRLEVTGISKGANRNTQEIYPNDLDQLRRKLMMNRLRGGTAAVILEPIGPESGTRPVLLNSISRNGSCAMNLVHC